jgi:hypothetical protein
MFLPDLDYLRQFEGGIDIGYDKEEELYLIGLMVTKDTGGVRFDGRNEYGISPYARTLLGIIDNE